MVVIQEGFKRNDLQGQGKDNKMRVDNRDTRDRKGKNKSTHI